jgi:hypothetical protein
MRLPEPGTPWRPALAQYAREQHELHLRHPWLLQTNRWRAPLAPHVLDAQEAGLRALVDTGLSPLQVVDTAAVIDSLVQGMSRAELAEKADSDATGLRNDDYWTSMAQFWEDWFDTERYPTMTRLYLAGAFDTQTAPFDAALERLLDAVEMTIDRASAAPQA